MRGIVGDVHAGMPPRWSLGAQALRWHLYLDSVAAFPVGRDNTALSGPMVRCSKQSWHGLRGSAAAREVNRSGASVRTPPSLQLAAPWLKAEGGISIAGRSQSREAMVKLRAEALFAATGFISKSRKPKSS